MHGVADFVDDLTRNGYVDSFRIEGDRLRATTSGRSFAPEDLELDVVERFEGDSNPDEESLVLALRSGDGDVRGTCCVAFGTGVQVLHRLLGRGRIEHGGQTDCDPAGMIDQAREGGGRGVGG